jgi:hypothetical protein
LNIEYKQWSLRGYDDPVYQVYVEIPDSHDTKQLRELKRRMNDPPHKGLIIAENKSKALKRLGWEYDDNGFYYKYFS